MRVLATAAVIAALAIGIWIGRAVLPVSGVSHSAGGGLSVSTLPGARESEALPVSFVMDPKFMRQRAQLLQSLGAQIAALPPDSRAKVLSSLQTIHDSMRDLEAALGKDPSNALLQELLVNTYQDEIRVLTAVNEAGDAAKGI
jgi:cysteine synthase